MSDTTTNTSVRIGFMSRIDFGSDGFRQGLLELAAETFKAEDCHFVVLAGGLVSGRAVAEKLKRIKKELSVIRRRLKAIKAEAEEGDGKTVARLLKEEKKLEDRQKALNADAADLTPESMADALAERLPKFTNGKGKPIKLYIVPSSPYDKADGERTAQLLAEKRDRNELRLLKTDGDRLPLWEDQPHERILEVLTPDKRVWLRGKYYSTVVQGRIDDKRRQTSSGEIADVQAVGGVGVSILKPEGQWPIGFMGLPALHRLEEMTSAENQVGVTVMEVEVGRRNVTMRSHSFKDYIHRERSFIGKPAKMKPDQETCIDVLRNLGRCTTGRLVEKTKLERGAVIKALRPLMSGPEHKRYSTWPGVSYDEPSDRWDFDLEWVKLNLRYRAPEGDRKTDNVVCICCMHAASLDTDYKHFLEGVPKVMLERGATMLISAGDHVEGTAHDLLMKGEIVLGIDNTKQEKLAAYMIAYVLCKVFKARFDAAAKAAGSKAFTAAETAELVRKTLPRFRYVPGNHCAWIHRSGVEPLVTMIHEIVRNLTRWVGKHLAARGHRVDDLMSIVEGHIETVGDGRFALDSGLKMGMTHPHMGGAETISSSMQKALMMYRDCQVVIIGNFHTGVVVEEWDQALGQRVGIQVGTMKHSSPFESSKLKSGLDQGFVWAKIDSIGGRVVRSETTFYSNDKAKPEEKRLDGDKPFYDFIDGLGIEDP